MDIKELNKKQLVLLTLLITFVVSIATGIVTVSLMQQVPKSVPQTINNVIQRTIEKVTTVQVQESVTSDKKVTLDDNKENSTVVMGDGDVLVSIYSYPKKVIEIIEEVTEETETLDPLSVLEPVPEEKLPVTETPKALGQGIIISDVGLILVESKILTGEDNYKVILNEIDFNASILKKFSNGFTILKITSKEKEIISKKEEGEIPAVQSELEVTKVDN